MMPLHDPLEVTHSMGTAGKGPGGERVAAGWVSRRSEVTRRAPLDSEAIPPAGEDVRLSALSHAPMIADVRWRGVCA